ncbi:MAG: hypothetical protein V1798_00760 [Pseudomonadota bacterium]
MIERTTKRRVRINGVGFDSYPLEPDPEKTLSRILAEYEQGMTQRELGRQFHCCWWTIHKILHAAGIKRHAGGRSGR